MKLFACFIVLCYAILLGMTIFLYRHNWCGKALLIVIFVSFFLSIAYSIWVLRHKSGKS